MANITRLGQSTRGSILTTIPKDIADAMRLKKGDKVEWVFAHGDIYVRKI